MKNEPTKLSIALLATAIFFAFLPSIIGLSIFTFAGTFLKQIPDANGRALLWLGCYVSVACCFIGSFMLFWRKTATAVLCGFLFLLLNATISFFLGCAASWRGL